MFRPSELALVFLTLTLAQHAHAHARTFTRCQLSRELLRYNFPRSLIASWVCLIEHASGRTTEKVTNHNNSYVSFGLFQDFEFVPFAVETAGKWCREAKELVRGISKRFINRGSDPRSGSYLIQRISLAIQCGNAASVMGTFGPGALGNSFNRY